MLRTDLHPEARKEYQDALRWYRQRGRELALRFADEFEAAVQRITQAPQRWPVGDILTRRVLLHGFPFVIHYRYHEARSYVWIVAVAHTSRDPAYWHKRQ